jgi:hypothetical protein
MAYAKIVKALAGNASDVVGITLTSINQFDDVVKAAAKNGEPKTLRPDFVPIVKDKPQYDDAVLDSFKQKADLSTQVSELVRVGNRGTGPQVTPDRVEEAKQFFQQNADLRSQGINPKEYFLDDAGESWRTDFKGQRVDGSMRYAWYNQDLKNVRNSQIPGKRNEAAEISTKGDRDFYKFRSNPDTDAHHIAELGRTSRLFKGLDKPARNALHNYLEKRGIVTGDKMYNRAELSKDLHKQLHSWFDKTYGRKKLNIENLSLNQRKKYIDQFIEEYNAVMEQIFTLRQNELRGA